MQWHPSLPPKGNSRPRPFRHREGSRRILTVVGVYRRLRISIVLFRGILFRGVTIKPIPAVFHIVRFAANGNRFRVDIALRKLGLPLLGEHRVVSPFVHGAYRIHTQDTRVCATRDIVDILPKVGRDFGEVLSVPLLKRALTAPMTVSFASSVGA